MKLISITTGNRYGSYTITGENCKGEIVTATTQDGILYDSFNAQQEGSTWDSSPDHYTEKEVEEICVELLKAQN